MAVYIKPREGNLSLSFSFFQRSVVLVVEAGWTVLSALRLLLDSMDSHHLDLMIVCSSCSLSVCDTSAKCVPSVC